MLCCLFDIIYHHPTLEGVNGYLARIVHHLLVIFQRIIQLIHQLGEIL